MGTKTGKVHTICTPCSKLSSPTLESFAANPACVLYVCVVPIAWALHVGILSSARCPNGVGGDNRYWQYRVPARHPVLETQQSDP